MHAIRIFLSTSLLLTTIAIAPLRSAEACSSAQCSGGHFLPEAATLPANLPGIVWMPRYGNGGSPDANGVGLFLVTPGGETAVPVTTTQPDPTTYRFLVVPQSPLLPDSDYVIRGADLCDGSGKIDGTATHTTLHTADSAPIPASLGDVTASDVPRGMIEVPTISGSCVFAIDAAQAKVDLTLAAEAAPWQKALELSIWVDGNRWSNPVPINVEPQLGGSLSGTLFSSCKSDDPGADKGLAEGTHSVTFRASLPGSAVALETAPVSVTLSCQAAGSSSSTGSGGGSSSSSGAGGGNVGPGGSSGGCSVVAGSSGSSAWMWAAALAGAMAAARRGRRRAPGR